jgi:putative membrane protein
MMNGFGGHGWGMGMGMCWWWIIGLIIVIAVVWMFVKGMSLSNRPGNQPESKSALDILKERYARGEINKQEFEERKRDLM